MVLVLRDKHLIRAITDCGGGGYSSAIGEMGQEIGVKVFLDKVPLKYKGLNPWEIFVSESQERMVLAIDPKHLKRVIEVCKLYNVPVSTIGEFDGSKRLKIVYGKKVICDIDMKFLHHGLPQRKMIGKTTNRKNFNFKEKRPSALKNLEAVWQKVMANPNVASKEPIVRLYDHNVQGSAVLHPFSGVDQDAPNDGSIVKPILGKPYGLAVAHGLNPILNRINPYLGSIWAIVEAVSNFVSIGGDIKNAALIDNFIWPFPDEESLADLDKSVDACANCAKVLGMPFISGKDSLSSTYRYPDGRVLKIPPVLLISVFGKIADIAKTASSDFKKVGSTIVLVGKQDHQSFGGSVYFDVVGAQSGKVSKVDLKNVKKVFASITKGIATGQILAAHDISEGGLAVAIAEMSFGAGFGASVDLSKTSKKSRPDYILFNETVGTFLVEVENEKVAKKLFAGVLHSIIGKTIKDKSIRINQGKKAVAIASIDKLKEFWQKPIKEIFH